MNIIKRSGEEVLFNPEKIAKAISKANASVPEEQMDANIIESITSSVSEQAEGLNHTPTVEEIQDMVVRALMSNGFYAIATHYIEYKYKRAQVRHANTTDQKILSLLSRTNEDAKQENSNKNPTIVSVQRDYMAGEVSKDITKRFLLDEDIMQAHEEGIIHFHDADYFAQPIHNCGVYNLNDMLQNGTVISGTMIEKPHSFATACNIATQAIAQIASCSYGGQSFSLAHLSPFIEVSRQKHRTNVRQELTDAGIEATDEAINKIAEERTLKEIDSGIQTIQYQLITLQTTNGQAPFVTVFMYLNEVPEGPERDDLALAIHSMLEHRILGVKNEKGVYITPAFPKLIYVLSENNIKPDSPYYDLTKLAATCTAKRMVPDYVSEKIMKQLKLSKGEKPGEGDVYGPMGCVAADEVITYRYGGRQYTESFKSMWDRLEFDTQFPDISYKATIKKQPGREKDLYMKLHDVQIYDQEEGFVDCYGLIQNADSEMLRLTFTDGRMLDCTPDHPLYTLNRGTVRADELSEEDELLTDRSQGAEQLGIAEYDRGRLVMYPDEDPDLYSDAFTWNDASRTEFVKLMWNGYGELLTEGFNTRDFESKTDALQMMLLLQSIGYKCGIYPATNGRFQIRIEDKMPETDEPVYTCRLKKREKIADQPSYDVTTASEHFTVSGIRSHNCRSFLTPDRSGNGYDNIANAMDYKEDEPKYYGRFNQGVVTLNLVDVALSSRKDKKEFWRLMDERLELCHRALQRRHEHLEHTPSDVAPILWQNGAIARLKKGETIDKLLHGGYSTISLGYAGVYEMTRYMTGHSHTEPEGQEFALKVMEYLNNACQRWKIVENIDYSVYGTPLESTTYKFAKCLQKRFGTIEDITDHGYITNSYHINVREEIDAFDKLTKEAAFQQLSPGGAISYIEVPNMQNNIPAVMAVLGHIYETIMYAELNTKSDYCQKCGYNGEIHIIEDENGKLIWECPSCGNRDQDTMNVARRTCGYIGTNYWNQGRTEEIRDRVMHL